MQHALKSLIQRYSLKTGLVLAILFPAIFVFDSQGKGAVDIILHFLSYFLFILSLWLFNFRMVEFSPLLRKGSSGRPILLLRGILISMLFSIGAYFITTFAMGQEQESLASLREANFSAKAWFFILLRIVLFNAGILIIKYLVDSNREKQRVQLENETLKTAQAHALHEIFKQQVDPHFLFNSLTTLQSLVRQTSPQAITFIQEMASVYRYMLAQGSKSVVSLEEEIAFLRSYLALLQIRFGPAFRAEILIDASYHGTLIPVHTLQLLAENAVKHNVISNQYPLLLSLTTENGQLTVQNNLQEKAQKSPGSGIGLQNIKNRYALLFGKEISIQISPASFRVQLPLIQSHDPTLQQFQYRKSSLESRKKRQ